MNVAIPIFYRVTRPPFDAGSARATPREVIELARQGIAQLTGATTTEPSI